MNNEKQYFLIKRFNRLLHKGYSLNNTIELMLPINPKIIGRMKILLEKGESLSTIFKILKFKRFVYETLEVGEKSNKINEIISLIEHQFEFYMKLKKQIFKVLLYPLILFLFALICFEMIRINLYPVIDTLLGDFSIKENKYLILIAFNLLKWLGGLGLFLFTILYYFKPLTNFFPFFKIYRTLTLTKHLEILLFCGNSLEEALIVLTRSFNQKIYYIDEFKQSLLQDKKLSSFTPYTTNFMQYFKLGIKSNDLVVSLQDYYLIYDEILFDQLSKLTYYIQFGLFSLLSMNIFLIYYIVMIPMLQISNKI